jgi:hypothetical protein
MSRFVLPARSLLTLALLGGLLASPVPAQPPGGAAAEESVGWGIGSPGTSDLLDVKELAKAKYEAVHADPRQLARERLAAARGAYRERWEEFLAGRGTLDILLDNSQRLLEAELAVSDRPGERVAALERNWERAAARWHITESRFRDGRVAISDYFELRYNLLGAEIAWARARQGERPARPRWGPAERFVLENGDEELSDSLREEEQRLARDKREALLADPADLARQRLEAARAGGRARLGEVLAGRGTLDVLADWAARLLEAKLALRDKPEDQLTAYESKWALAKQLEVVNDARFAASRVPHADYLRTKYDRLDAELRWGEARARLGQSGRSELGARAPWLWIYLPEQGSDADDSSGGLRQLARVKREALRADPRELARERLAAARGAYRERWEEFLAGRGTLDILLDESQRVLTSELAMGAKPAERAAAWERQWTRLRRIEAINEERFKAGRVAVADMMESRCLRLDAEIHWAEARAVQQKQ